MAADDYDFEFLGLKIRYPKEIFSCVYSVIFSLSIAGIVGGVIYSLGTEGVKDVIDNFVTGKIDSKGSYEINKESGYTIQFWTPNADTYDSIKLSVNEDVDLSAEEKIKKIANAKWQKIDNTKVVGFEKKLVESDNFHGWRHHRVDGKGRTPRKTGQWWVVSPKSGIDIDYVARIYKNYWNNTDSVYFEIYGGKRQYGAKKKHVTN